MPGTFRVVSEGIFTKRSESSTLPLGKTVETMNRKGLCILHGHRSFHELEKTGNLSLRTKMIQKQLDTIKYRMPR